MWCNGYRIDGQFAELVEEFGLEVGEQQETGSLLTGSGGTAQSVDVLRRVRRQTQLTLIFTYKISRTSISRTNAKAKALEGGEGVPEERG